MYNMEFSPPKPPPRLPLQQSKWFTVNPLTPEEQITEERHVLILKPFTAIPHISFKKVKLGCVKSCVLYIQNPLDIVQHVRVEKLPSDKGFSVEQDEFSLMAGEEKALTIVWAPEKSFSCRETISFKSSSGCKTQAYLLGTAYSPKKVTQKKVIVTKTKKHHGKKTSPRTVKPYATSEKTVFSTNFIINEEKKENFDFTNSTSLSFLNIPESSHFKYLSTPESFSRRPDNGFLDSPIRRQTYTINSMLLHGRESEVLPLQVKETLRDVSIIENSWQKSEAGFTLNQSTFNFSNSRSSNLISLPPEVKRLHCEDNLNDSLENVNIKHKTNLPVHLNDSLIDTNAKYETVLLETTNAQDYVETYDVANKHLYFGITPQQPKSLEKLELMQSDIFSSNKSEGNRSLIHDQSLDFSNKLTISDNLQRMSPIEYPLSDAVDCFKQPFEVKSRKSPLNFSDFFDDSFDLKSSTPANQFPLSASINNPSRTKSLNVIHSAQTMESPFEYEYRNSVHEIQPSCNIASEKYASSNSQNLNHSNILLLKDQLKTEDFYLNKEILSECDDMKGKVQKEIKSSLFMEIPCENSNVSSVTLKNSRKHVKSSFSKKVHEKKEKLSPFKAKVSKPGSLVASKGVLRKNLSVSSKTGICVKEKRLKFMPHKLCLTKPRMTESIVYHRNPFASMNIYYDERWIEKQEAAFTSWLNFVLTPNDEFISEDVKVDSAKLWIESIKETSSIPAPTKEELSLKAYTAARNLNLLRKSSCQLYQSDEIKIVIKKIEKEVDLKRISIRKDRAIHADLGIKKNILEMLLSYNTLWLRIGLETIYGEVINLQNNSDVIGLSRFLIHRFLQNPEISSKFSHPAVINYYKKGYEDEIQRFTLKKFLLLVFFLDTAKNGHLIKHNPCLFNKNSKYKASRDLLLVFSREYLSGEGDVTKHLRYLGYKVSYQQSPLEEFDYSVRNIAVDLRCGLRLGRVVELILEDWTISQKLRINTLNRLTKIHNNDVILKALKYAGIEIENNIEAKNITDGDREKTLDLLWQIIFKTQISKLINKELLKKENAFLIRNLKLRADFAAYNALRNHTSASNSHTISIHDSKLYKENEILQLLFQWCKNVCSHYGVKVHNFTSSFSDGRVLCLLLHHYHPNVLSYESIKFETTSNYFEEQMNEAETIENCPFIVQNGQSNSKLDKLLKNERDNLTLVFQKFQEVGHIPILSNCSDMSNTLPDEKVMVTLVSYINIRLMELSIEIRAARKILHAWRQYKLRKQHERLKLEIWAITIIQRAWKKYLVKKRIIKETKASIVIQSYWRMYAAQKQLSHLKYQKRLEYLSKNAIIIQIMESSSNVTLLTLDNYDVWKRDIKVILLDRECWEFVNKTAEELPADASVDAKLAAYRGFSTRKLLLKHQQAAIVIQTAFRKWLGRSRFMKLKNIAIQIQQNYRAKIAGRAEYHKYLNLRKNIIKLQALTRGLLARAHFKLVKYSAGKIQAYIRMWLQRKKYIKIKNACILIQQKFKGHSLMKYYRQEYQNKRSAAIAIQKWYRTIKIYQYKVQCVKKVQACVRRFLARREYMILRQNVIKIQIWWHSIMIGRKTRLQYLQYYRSIIYVQSCVRKNIASRKYRRIKQFIRIIQKCIRGFIARRRYSKLKRNSMFIQNVWRAKQLARKSRSEYLRYRSKVILVQSLIRRFLVLKEYKKNQQAAITIQKHVRGLITRRRYFSLKNYAVKIQSFWRAKQLAQKTRSEYLLYRSKIILIQSLIRRFLALKEFKINKDAAITIQKYVRGFIAKRRYSDLKKTTVKIQTLWRAKQLAKKTRSEYLLYQSKVILIQSLIRRYLAVKEFKKNKHAVITIQKHLLGLIARRKYFDLKNSTVKIQTFWRAKQLARKTRSEYLSYRSKVIFAQSYIRRTLVLKEFQRIKLAAIAIQKHVRGLIARRRYSRLKNYAVKIQTFWRATLLARKTHSEYLSYRSKVIFAQSCVRRTLAVKKFKKNKDAAIIIQKHVRGLIARKRYSDLKKSAVKIQTFWRSNQLARKTHSEYLSCRLKVILVQSYIRRNLVLKKFKKEKHAAITIQKHVRGFITRKKYSNLKNNTLKIQTFWRARQLARKSRSEYLTYRSKVILVQSCIRCFFALKDFKKKRDAVITIQNYFRSAIAGREQRLEYMKIRENIIHLQASTRGWLVRRHLKRHHHSAAKIQSYVKMWLLRKKYIKMQNACIILQQKFRAYLLKEHCKQEYQRKRSAAVAIQRWYRAVKVHEHKVQCIIKVQACARRFITRRKYVNFRQSVCKIQTWWRAVAAGTKTRFEYLKCYKNIVSTQSVIRMFIALRNYRRMKQSAITIQKYVRGFIAKRQYSNIKKSTMLIQKLWRAKVLGRKIRSKFLSYRSNVILLQSFIRRSFAVKDFKMKKNSAVTIQKFYRARLTGKVQRQKYIKMRENSIKIQAAVRGWLVIKHLNKQNECAVKIQSYVRMWLLKKKYFKIRGSCIIIQQKFRAYLLKEIYKQKYKNLRVATIVIQTWYRAVKIYQHKVLCVTKLQACVRRFIARKKYINLKESVIRIQTWWRAILLGKSTRLQYLKSYKNIVQLQASIRMFIASRKYRKIKQSFVTIQKYARKYITKRKFCLMKNSAIIIQNLWRATLLARKIQSEFLSYRQKVIIIQAFVRRFLIRRDFIKKRHTAITVQKYFRAKLVGRAQREMYLSNKKDIIMLQALTRGWLVRKHLKEQGCAATKIQSIIRMWLLSKKYQKHRNACIFIQQKFRAYLLKEYCKSEYKKQHSAIITIQKWYRAVKAYQHKVQCVVKVQACVRRFLNRKKYLTLRASIVKIQIWWHATMIGRKLRLQYLKNYRSIVCAQSVIRMYIASKQYKKMKKYAVIIQKYVRGFNTRRKYFELKKKTVMIQRLWRAKVLGRRTRSKYLSDRSKIILVQSLTRRFLAYDDFQKKKRAAITIQQIFRAKLAGQVQKQRYVRIRENIIKIQAFTRSWLARKRIQKLHHSSTKIQSYVRMWLLRKKYIRTRNACIAIQQKFRGYLLKVFFKKEYQSQRSSAILIQRWYRAIRIHQHKVQCIMKVQACVRRFLARRKYVILYQSIVRIQTWWHATVTGKRVRVQYLQYYKNIVCLQSLVRKYIARKKFVVMKQSSITIQKYIRGLIARKRYSELKSNTIKIQNIWRAKQLAQETRSRYLLYRSKVILVQSLIRRHFSLRDFKKKKQAVITIQIYFRAVVASRVQRLEYVNLRENIIKLQAFARGNLIRRHLKKKIQSAIQIQSFVRMWILRKKYIEMKNAATTIERKFRDYRIMKYYRQEYQNKRSAAITIQKWYRAIRMHQFKVQCVTQVQACVRRYLAARKYVILRQSVIKIQIWWQAILLGREIRSHYLQYYRRIVYIQSFIRKFIVSQKYRKLKKSAITIQKYARGFIARREFLLKKKGVLVIQNAWRAKLLARKIQTGDFSYSIGPLPEALVQRLGYVHLRNSVIQFQRAARTYLKRHHAATVIQSYFRMWCVQQQFKKVKAALRIQSCWRGFLVRRSVTDKKILEARKKIHAADSSEAKKLKNRTSRSLELLLFKDVLLQNMLTALQELDVCTQLSPKCCERLVQSGGLTILIRLVHSCNRSIPHMELIKLTTNILLTLAKYEKTVNYVWEEEDILTTILHLMKIFREKGAAIFTKCCSLLWIFSQDPDKAKVMSDDTAVIEQIRSFHYLLTRKQSLEQKRLVAKAFIASKSFNTSVLSKTMNSSVCQRDSWQIDPDWKLGKYRRREFKDPVIAITWIMKSLGIASKGGNV